MRGKGETVPAPQARNGSNDSKRVVLKWLGNSAAKN
jgi:hypothetical protein